MALDTQCFFPSFPDVFRVLEFQGLVALSVGHAVVGSLSIDNMAETAVLGYGPSFFAQMLVIMAAETTGGIHVSYMIWVSFPADIHYRKNILGKCFLNPSYGGFDAVRMLFKDIRIVI